MDSASTLAVPQIAYAFLSPGAEGYCIRVGTSQPGSNRNENANYQQDDRLGDQSSGHYIPYLAPNDARHWIYYGYEYSGLDEFVSY